MAAYIYPLLTLLRRDLHWMVVVIVTSFCFLTGIVVTNDGNAILRELDLAHPAAKVIVVKHHFGSYIV
jgi:hypothetical protein